MRRELYVGLLFALLSMACGSCKSGATDADSQEGTEDCSELLQAALSGAEIPSDAAVDFHHSDLGRVLREVYECRVVETDSDTACAHLGAGARHNCRARYHFFHEARNRSDSTSWPTLMGAGLHLECENLDESFSSQTCQAVEQAVASQRPSLCPDSSSPLHQFCQGIATSAPERCGGDADCEELADRLRLLESGGLELVAAEGTVRDRRHAAAVLGRADACEPIVRQFEELCRENRSGE